MTAKNLVIVESPAKAKTISGYLGADFQVESSYGHVRDLVKKSPKKEDFLVEGVTTDFDPVYEISEDKKTVITKLKKAAKNKTVWLASDEDREGEAIAWHLCHSLNLPVETTQRLAFHEITKTALQAAIKSPRKINVPLVNAQQARRVLDRLVGFKLSPLVSNKLRRRGLSAGRVQSVAVRLIVERESEIQAFQGTSHYPVVAQIKTDDTTFQATLDTTFSTEKEVEDFFPVANGKTWKVSDIKLSAIERQPSAPFTTSTLQQEASQQLGYSVRYTMQLAQRLYEAGHITYMRTDSVHLSQQAQTQIAQYIKSEYGADHHQPRTFAAKSKNAQEAHEAIRPTKFSAENLSGLESAQQRLYSLIFKRAVASQMAAAKGEKTVIEFSAQGVEPQLVAKGEVWKFLGWMSLSGKTSPDQLLPVMKAGQVANITQWQSKQTFKRPPSRYTEASLVRELEKRGIGRPSTYAPTISTIEDRGYVEKKDQEPKTRPVNIITIEPGQISAEKRTESENFGAEKAKLFPMPVGKLLIDFLVKYMAEIMNYDFTAEVEVDFDAVASGEKDWKKMLKNFYQNFTPTLERAEKVSSTEVQQIRELGQDPASKKPIFARLGRFGPLLQRGQADDEETPEFTTLREPYTIESITLEEALELFKTGLPRTLGETDGQPVVVKEGRFGPYLQVGKTNVSLKSSADTPELDPYVINLEQAVAVYQEHQKTQANNLLGDWSEHGLMLKRGPFGIYIKSDKKGNIPIPKDQKEKAEKLSLAECQAIEEAFVPKARKSRFKKKA